MRTALFVAMAVAAVAPRAARAEEVRLVVELATEDGFTGLDSQQWLKLFADLGVDDVQIRQARAGDKPEVLDDGGGVLRVRGVLTARGDLVLPGGRYGLRDAGRIGAALDRLRSPAAESGGQLDIPFDLPADVYLSIHEDLKRRVAISTTDVAAAEAVQQIAETLDTPVGYDPGAEAALAECDVVQDELQGLAAGTALAAVLRPAGLGLVPIAGRAGPRLQIMSAEEVEDRWPVGLKVAKKNDVLPDLLEFLTVEVENRPVLDVARAIGARLETPILLDHNALAYHELDAAKLRISLPESRTTYGLALHKALVKAGLLEELRVDDAGRPFFWITTRAPVR
jgi:hypothetical protein